MRLRIGVLEGEKNFSFFFDFIYLLNLACF
jgi:hypothetical protein